MKRAMALQIRDAAHDVVRDVKMALAKEQHDRGELCARWILAGHIKVVEDNNPSAIAILIEDQAFSCARDKYPTIELVAQLQLAIHAGLSNRKTGVGSGAGGGPPAMDQLNAYGHAYSHAYGHAYSRVWMDEASQVRIEAVDFLAEHKQPSEAGFPRRVTLSSVTATVKKFKKLMKGRP